MDARMIVPGIMRVTRNGRCDWVKGRHRMSMHSLFVMTMSEEQRTA
jgi:hypothetical protein